MFNVHSRVILPNDLDELQAVFDEVLRPRHLPQNRQDAELLAVRLTDLYQGGVRDAASLRAKLLNQGETQGAIRRIKWPTNLGGRALPRWILNRLDEGRVPAVPSRDEANVEPDEALPEDSEEEILDDDPAREKTRFDEEVPKSSR